VLVGDVAPARATAAADAALAGWSGPPALSPLVPAAASPAAGSPPRIIVVDRPGAPQSEVFVGHRGPSAAVPEEAALCVLETALGGSFTSRLVQNLRERHAYTYGVGARFEMLRDGGTFVVSSAVYTAVTGPALTEIDRELRGVQGAVQDHEVAKARAIFLSSLTDAFREGEGAAQLLGRQAGAGLAPDHWALLPTAVERVDAAAVRRAARRWIHPAETISVVVGDRGAVEPTLRLLPGGGRIELRNTDGERLPSR
jgi:zinc protease